MVQKLPIAKGEFFIALLIFELLQPVGTFLLRFVFTGYVDGILFLIKRIDFMGHEVGDVFFVEFDRNDGAVFLLEMEKELFHTEGGDGAGEAPDLAGLLAAFYVVLEGFGDGGGVFVGDGEGAAGGVAGPGDVQGEVVFVHVPVEGLHGFQNFICIISQAVHIIPMAEGVHDVQKAGAGFVENVHLSFFIASVEEGVWVIQGAQLDVEGSGGHSEELDWGIIKFSLSSAGLGGAVFYFPDDVLANEAEGFFQVLGEVIEGGKGHHARRQTRYSEMEVDNFPFLGDFFFKVCDELLFLFIGLPVDAVGYLHGEGDFSFRCVVRVVVQHFSLDGKLPLHFTEPFQFILYHLR